MTGVCACCGVHLGDASHSIKLMVDLRSVSTLRVCVRCRDRIDDALRDALTETRLQLELEADTRARIGAQP